MNLFALCNRRSVAARVERIEEDVRAAVDGEAVADGEDLVKETSGQG